MAKHFIFHLICNSNTIKSKSSLHVLLKKLHTKVPTKEIKIPILYGHMAAKLWGSNENRPILALHGWQDNAGTWDPLALLLAEGRSILALDFPGHGLSSWYPPGMMYYHWEWPRTILYLKEYFKWDKVSLLCHSMGAIAGIHYTCLYPDDVDFIIAIDSLIYDDYVLKRIADAYPKLLEKGLVAQTRLDKEPPVYTKDELKIVWHYKSGKSVSLESTRYLMERGVRPSKRDPTKYYFSRDPRLKYILFNPETREFTESLVRRLKCPTLYVKATDSPYSVDEYSVEIRKLIQKNNINFELHFLPGTHYVHLNDPEKVAPLILNFLKKSCRFG